MIVGQLSNEAAWLITGESGHKLLNKATYKITGDFFELLLNKVDNPALRVEQRKLNVSNSDKLSQAMQ